MARQSVIYLDYAAATPLDQDVRRAMEPYFTDNFYNPSATYGAARDVGRALLAARGRLAHWLGARSSEVIFTAGGTEANNLAIHGVMRQFPGANIVVSAIEHESVMEPAGAHDRRAVVVKPDGRLDLEDLRRKIDADTVLVSIMYANNEIGTIQPIREVAKIVAEQRCERQTKSRAKARPLYLHTDACQAANYLDLHVSRLGVDLLTINGGKIYGPKQSGALYVKAGLEPRPLIQGGGQERGLRSGTENVPAAIGLAAALDLVQASRHQEVKRLQAVQHHFFESLRRLIPTAIINGSRKHRLPNNIHLTIPGQDNERLLIQLDQAGILAAAGSACSASRETPSHVLRALGLTDAEARSSLRFTLGRGSTEVMVERCSQVLAKLLP